MSPRPSKYRKLSESEVNDVRCEYVVGVGLDAIAKRHGISWAEASGIANRVLYEDVAATEEELAMRRYMRRVSR